jgi:hypothetical protein
MGYYDTAQICKNGHVINKYYGTKVDERRDFCGECGAAAVTACESCRKSIKGDYHSDVVFSVGNYKPSKFCPHCGNPYPWTASKLDAAKELFNELEGLETEDRRILGESLDNLITDNPRTELAGFRFKLIMKKLGKGSVEIVKTVMSEVVSEGIKKSLFGP